MGRDDNSPASGATSSAAALEPHPSLGANLHRSKFLPLALTGVLSAAYVIGFVDRGWIPHDEGTLAQSAERVLAGELPHRDHDQAYTGALTYLHAAAFRILGVRLLSLRWVLFLFFLLFVFAVFAIAARMAAPWVASLITLLGVVWSVPNYFASLPSWYNLFFAAFGALALLRHVETGRRRWLLAAGVCGGLSVIVKIVGLYFIAAALLFLSYREQVLSAGAKPVRRPGSPALLIAKAIASGFFVGVLFFLIRTRLSLPDVVHFVLPGSALAGFLLASEWRDGVGRFGERFRSLLRLCLPFLVGAAVPIALFLVPYLTTGSLDDLFRGVFGLLPRQIGKARTHLPPLETLWPAVPYAAVLTMPWLVPRRRERMLALGVALLLGFGLAFSVSPDVYAPLWHSARSLAVVAGLAGCFVLARFTEEGAVPGGKRQELFLLVALTALVSLVQFPFSAPIYFCYVAPVAALAILSLVTAQPEAPRMVHLCVLVFYILFAIFRTHPSYVFNLGHRFEPYRAETLLDLERGGLRVRALEAREYKDLIEAIRKRPAGATLYAGPDSPEVYFLSRRPNPTRFFFEFQAGPEGEPEAILRMLEEKKVAIVALNRSPDFSPKPRPRFRAELQRRYPHSMEIGKFVLMWKD